MGNLNAFFRENVKVQDNTIERVISNRMLDNDGQPIKWKFKPIRYTELLDIIDKNTEVKATTKDGASTSIKTKALLMDQAINTVVFPPLKNKKLQDSWGVFTPEDLLNVMLGDNNNEWKKLFDTVQELNGKGKEQDKQEKEVKN